MDIYQITRSFPKVEVYGLTSQIRRAAVSVTSNIAEGYGRNTTPDYIGFLCIAYGSNCELETQLLLSRDLDYMKNGEIRRIHKNLGDVERMLKALIKSLESKPLTLDPWNPWTLFLMTDQK